MRPCWARADEKARTVERRKCTEKSVDRYTCFGGDAAECPEDFLAEKTLKKLHKQKCWHQLLRVLYLYAKRSREFQEHGVNIDESDRETNCIFLI